MSQIRNFKSPGSFTKKKKKEEKKKVIYFIDIFYLIQYIHILFQHIIIVLKLLMVHFTFLFSHTRSLKPSV